MDEMRIEDCLLIFDSTGNLTDCNQNSLDFFDISKKRELAEQLAVLSSKYPTDGLACGGTFIEYIRNVVNSGSINIDWIFSRADGRLIQTYVKLVGIDLNHVLCQIRMRYEDDKTLKEKLAMAEEQRVRIMLDSIPAICTFWDESRNLIFCNQSAAEHFELEKPQDYIDRFGELSPIRQPCGVSSMKKALHYVNIAFETGYSQFDWIHQKLDGTPMPSRVTLIRVNWQGEHGLVGFTEDMREKYAEDKLHEDYQQRLLFILDNVPMIVGVWDVDGSMLDCNEFTVKTLSISRNIRHYLDISTPIQPCGTDSLALAKEYIEQAYKNGKANFNWVYQKPCGEEIPCEVSLMLVQWEGKPALVSFARDLRDFIKYQKNEAAMQQRLQAMLDASPMVCAVFDENINVLEVNQEVVNVLKLSNKQEYIDNFFALSPEFQPDGISTREKAIEAFTNAVVTGEGHIKEWVQLTSDGEGIPFEIYLKRMELGEKTAVITYARDLREYYKLGELENISKQRLQAMLDASPIICAIFDEYINVVEVNQAAVDILKLSGKQEYVDRFFELMPEFQPDGILTREKAIDAFIQTVKLGDGYIKEWIMFNSEGECIPFEVHLKSMELDGKKTVVMYAYDLRESYKLMEAERKSGEMFSRLLEASPMFIEIRDEQLNLIDCNGQVASLFGAASKEEFIEENERYYPKYQPCGTPSKEKETVLLKQVLQDGYLQFEYTHLTVDGEDLPLEFTYVRLHNNDKTTIVGYAYDLRHIRLIEKQRLEISEESNKAKSRFLARMSHEIRTPISAVLGLSEIQLRNHVMPSQTEEVFTKIYDSAKSLLTIVNDILDFSKIESGKMSLINNMYDVSSLINDASQLHLVYLEHKDIKFQLHVDENLPVYLEGDVLRIRQIINNLLTNAFKYTESGSVTLSIQCKKDKEDYVMLVISIQDTGTGMTQEQIEKIQDLNSEYVRLHEQEKPFVSGTGLGFPIVYSLLQIMDAHIDLESEVGKGTCAIVHIPQKAIGSEVLGKEAVRSLQNFEAGKWQGAKEFEFKPEPMPYGKVLVVDDVELNLLVAKGMLEAYELNIGLCESGIDAIEKIKQGEVYDIIFMDHMMPEMGGIEATKILRDMGYNHPIVALTANAVKGQEEMFMNNGFSGFISKPIDIKVMNSYLVRFIRDK